jgi:hypothetical protein
MTTAEAILIIISVVLFAILLFLLYYYFKGTSWNVSIDRPVENRVDEYLDRHFEDMVEEWSLMNKSQVWAFREHNDSALIKEEKRMGGLKEFRHEMTDTLSSLEERLNVLETEISRK